MLWSFATLRGWSLRATDGSIGEVADLLVEDVGWRVRYLVADTARWLVGRRVLIVSAVLGHPDAAAGEFPVDLTRQQVRDSPDIDTDKPVSRQQEISLHGYYGWWPYWTYAAAAVPPLYATDPLAEGHLRDMAARGDPHLRSARELQGYAVAAEDGDAGEVADFLVDDDGWVIRYLVVDTGRWLPGRKVLLAADWASAVRWDEKAMQVPIPRRRIEEGPDYDAVKSVDRDYEQRLYSHYGHRPYW